MADTATQVVKQPKEKLFSKKNMKALREPLSDNNPISYTPWA